MDKQKQNKVDRLKIEADRYSIQQGWRSSEKSSQSICSALYQRFMSIRPSNRYGLAAILVGYPGLVPIIAVGGTTSISHELTIFCLALISASVPLWFLASVVQRSER